MHYYVVEICDRFTGEVICEQVVEATTRRSAGWIAMFARDPRHYEAGYVYREE